MLRMIDDLNVVDILQDRKNLQIVTVSDLHTGHVVGYLPDNCLTKSNHLVQQSPFQQRMQRHIVSYFKELGNIDVLIVLGDSCEGKQIRMAGIGLHDADTDCMVRWSVQSILEFCKYLNPKAIIFVKGTDYHVTAGIGGDLDYQVASMLSASYDVYYGTEIYAKLGQNVWYLRHYYPTVSVNRTMPLEKMFRFKARDWAADKLKVFPDVMAFGHIHLCLGILKIEQRTYAFTAPSLKGKDSYMKSKGYGWEGDVGVVYLEQKGKYIDHFHFERVTED